MSVHFYDNAGDKRDRLWNWCRKLPDTTCDRLELQFADTHITHTTPADTSDDGPLAASCKEARTEGGALLVYLRHYQLFRTDCGPWGE
jgi:hypothetical protein